MLEDKGILHRCYTQNIDCLETQAGMSPAKLVEAHGSFATATCLRCKTRSSVDDIRAHIEEQEVVRCQRPGCKGKSDALVKPDIVCASVACCTRLGDTR
jgi:NAD-dependent SIR2 family protein deacetylase